MSRNSKSTASQIMDDAQESNVGSLNMKIDPRIVKYENLTLVTNGYRNRVLEDNNGNIISIDDRYDDYDSLKEDWEAKFRGVAKERLSPAAGDNGVYSGRFLGMVNVLTDPKNIYCPNPFLGMVCLGRKYPIYNAGEEGDIKSLFPKGVIGVAQDRDWWRFVCDLSGNSMTSVALRAIKNGHRIVFALSGIEYFVYKDDLMELLSAIMKGGDEAFTEAKKHIRFVGPDLDTTIPARLLPCAMPYNKEALNRLVPGTKSHGLRRIAILLNIVSPIPEDGKTDPSEDSKALEKAFNDDDFEPIVYNTGTTNTAKSASINDDELEELIDKYSSQVGNSPIRITRMMKADGISIRAKRVARLMGIEWEAKSKKNSNIDVDDEDEEDVEDNSEEKMTVKKTLIKKKAKREVVVD